MRKKPSVAQRVAHELFVEYEGVKADVQRRALDVRTSEHQLGEIVARRDALLFAAMRVHEVEAKVGGS